MKHFILTMMACLLLPAVALAHTSYGDIAGITHGFMHPMLGLDHMLAMVAVGLWASQLGARARWVVPSAFIITMIAGSLLAFFGVSLPLVEQGTMLSVLVIGLIITSAFKTSLRFSTAIVSLFAIFHGYAHAMAMPVLSNSSAYVIGFLLATALLHIIGIGLGSIMNNLKAYGIVRITGIIIRF